MKQKTEREEKQIEHKIMILYQRAEQRRLHKERRKRQKMMEREKAKEGTSEESSKNKELWTEVMVLMTDLTRLEKRKRYGSQLISKCGSMMQVSAAILSQLLVLRLLRLHLK